MLGDLRPALARADEALYMTKLKPPSSSRSDTELVVTQLRKAALLRTGQLDSGPKEAEPFFDPSDPFREPLLGELLAAGAPDLLRIPEAEESLERARRIGILPAIALAAFAAGASHVSASGADRAHSYLDESIDLLRRMQARSWLAQALVVR